jgi:hypothetical protein
MHSTPDYRSLYWLILTGGMLLATLWSSLAQAIPAFARQYEMSCAMCHSAFPRLNEFGEHFRDSNYRLPGWKEKLSVNTGDDMLALPKAPAFAIRAQAFVQARQARQVNDTYTGFSANNAETDFQAPYLIKLLSSAPLSDHITYYFYGIFAEKGDNGTTLIEDAWFRHDDTFGSGIGTMLGQFQISDLMFPRETRLPFQDFMAYRFSNITYQRGVIFDRDIGPLTLALGAVNGNGINANYNINSPGYNRPDRMFDNDSRKDSFGRIGVKAGPVTIGVFGLSGEQLSIDNITDPLGLTAGTRDTRRTIMGLDLSGSLGTRTHWYAQGLWNKWKGIFDADPTQNYRWCAGFAGVDFVYSPRWTYSLLYNYSEPNDLEGTSTIYEGIKINSVSVTAAYYFMRNVKGVIEINGDLEQTTPDNFVAHPTKEGYVLLGLDAAF